MIETVIPAIESGDALETALADALVRVTANERFDVVLAIAAELKARREARVGVVDLANHRANRKRS